MIGEIKSAIKSKGAGEAVLYAGLLGLVLSDVIPTPADAVYFRLMEKNKALLEDGKITPRQYWTRDATLYYGLNPLWWLLVLGIVYKTKGSLADKARWGIAVVGAGAVLGAISKNIKEEERKKIIRRIESNT
jgi:hypothetical protein